MPPLHLIPAEDAHGRLRAVIESPEGSRNKLKYDVELGLFRVTQTLPAGSSFPFDFGFIPGTRGQDGDPIDVLVLMDGPAYPGCLLTLTLLGVIEAEQQEPMGPWIRNDRLIEIAEGSTERGSPRRLRDLDRLLLEQIEAFFTQYNRLRGVEFRPLRRRGPRTARRLLEQARTG
jgi:inorganic pyrophosphatase